MKGMKLAAIRFINKKKEINNHNKRVFTAEMTVDVTNGSSFCAADKHF